MFSVLCDDWQETPGKARSAIPENWTNFCIFLFIFSSVWLEVDISHPEQINQWVSSRDLGLKYSATFNDFTQR